MTARRRAVAVKDSDRFGRKRTCGSCGKRFYDFGAAEAACPGCGTPAGASTSFEIEEFITLDDGEEAEDLQHAEVEDAEVDLDDDDALDDLDETLADLDGGEV
ncbi:MAG: FYDLN acid domain-containing protein [Myxococcota bacterium]